MSAAQQLIDQPTITLWRSLQEPVGVREALDWRELMARPALTTPAVLEDKLQGRGWSPASFIGDRRRKDAVERVYALVLDYEAKDGAPAASIEDALDLWGGALMLLHTSYSHAPASPRFRVVLPLIEGVTAEQYAVLWRWAASRCAEVGHSIDEACRDASRLWFLPAVPPGGEEHFQCKVLDPGVMFDAHAAIDQQMAREAPLPPATLAPVAPGLAKTHAPGREELGPRRFGQSALESALRNLRAAGKGSRHNTLAREAYALGGLAPAGALTVNEIE
ncbi:MAG: hypothetical protein EOO74_03385, partial [Myxococcales bacterium]